MNNVKMTLNEQRRVERKKYTPARFPKRWGTMKTKKN